jgi:hypothetical protein
MNALRRRPPRSWSPSTRHKVPDSDAGDPRSRRHNWSQELLTAAGAADAAEPDSPR